MKSKAIIIGNGFSSQLLPAYRDDTLKKRLHKMMPKLVDFLDQLWIDVFYVFSKGVEGIGATSPIYREHYGVFDSEDVCFNPSYELVINKFEGYVVSFVDMLKRYNVDTKTSKRVFEKYISDPYSCLRYYVYNKKINAIEPYYSLGKMAFDLGLVIKNDLICLEAAIKHVFRNNGEYKFQCVKVEQCVNTSISVSSNENIKDIFASNAKHFLDEYNIIYTTNYDCLLEDLTNIEVRHIHGSFECAKIGRNNSWNIVDDIILGVTGAQKEGYISSLGERNLYIHYLNTIKSSKINEIHLFGYSGINDQHINECILNNALIKKIYYYGNPSQIEKSPKEYEEYVKMCLGMLFKDTRKQLLIKPWTDIWDQLYV